MIGMKKGLAGCVLPLVFVGKFGTGFGKRTQNS